MTWRFIENRIGYGAVTDIDDTTAAYPLGTIARATHPTYGEGEFIYLMGVASTVAGSVVEYSRSTWATSLETGTINQPVPVAVAMAATSAATKFGWYQISGVAAAAKSSSSISLASGSFIQASAGFVVVGATGLVLNGCRLAANASAKTGVITALIMINRPTGPGAT
jgi:hypothetical protein